MPTFMPQHVAQTRVGLAAGSAFQQAQAGRHSVGHARCLQQMGDAFQAWALLQLVLEPSA